MKRNRYYPPGFDQYADQHRDATNFHVYQYAASVYCNQNLYCDGSY